MITAIFGPGDQRHHRHRHLQRAGVRPRRPRRRDVVWPREYIWPPAPPAREGADHLEHILPTSPRCLLVQGTIQFALGILADPGSLIRAWRAAAHASWGRMLFDAQTRMIVAPHLALVPRLAIVITVLGLNLLGDGLRDRSIRAEARAMSLLEIEKLRLDIGSMPVLRGVDLAIEQGEVMGLVGESGSGKSMTALAVMQLLPIAMRASGRITFDGIDILGAPEAAMNRLRGNEIGMVFQEPMTALNPVKTIGEQVAEGIRWHTRASALRRRARTKNA